MAFDEFFNVSQTEIPKYLKEVLDKSKYPDQIRLIRSSSNNAYVHYGGSQGKDPNWDRKLYIVCPGKYTIKELRNKYEDDPNMQNICKNISRIPTSQAATTQAATTQACKADPAKIPTKLTGCRAKDHCFTKSNGTPNCRNDSGRPWCYIKANSKGICKGVSDRWGKHYDKTGGQYQYDINGCVYIDGKSRYCECDYDNECREKNYCNDWDGPGTTPWCYTKGKCGTKDKKTCTLPEVVQDRIDQQNKKKAEAENKCKLKGYTDCTEMVKEEKCQKDGFKNCKEKGKDKMCKEQGYKDCREKALVKFSKDKVAEKYEIRRVGKSKALISKKDCEGIVGKELVRVGFADKIGSSFANSGLHPGGCQIINYKDKQTCKKYFDLNQDSCKLIRYNTNLEQNKKTSLCYNHACIDEKVSYKVNYCKKKKKSPDYCSSKCSNCDGWVSQWNSCLPESKIAITKDAYAYKTKARDNTDKKYPGPWDCRKCEKKSDKPDMSTKYKCDDLIKPKKKWCEEKQKAHNIIPAVSWGSLTDAYEKEIWDHYKCNNIVKVVPKKSGPYCNCSNDKNSTVCKDSGADLNKICEKMKGNCLSTSGWWGDTWQHCLNTSINCKSSKPRCDKGKKPYEYEGDGTERYYVRGTPKAYVGGKNWKGVKDCFNFAKKKGLKDLEAGTNLVFENNRSKNKKCYVYRADNTQAVLKQLEAGSDITSKKSKAWIIKAVQ